MKILSAETENSSLDLIRRSEIMKLSPIVFVFILAFLPSPVAPWSTTDETSLRGSLISGYETAVRPNQTVNVDVAFQFTSIVGLSIKQQTFAVSGYWILNWEDSRLVWDPSTYGGIDCLYYFQDTLWTPSLVVTNSNDDLSAIDEDTIPLRVMYTGAIEWTPPCIVTVGCEMDTTKFPFDTQTCWLEVSPSGYLAADIDVDSNRGFMFDYFSEDGDWSILGAASESTTFFDNSKEYSKMTFAVTLKRRSAYHWINIIIPIVVSGILANFVFLLPVESGEKMGYSLTCLLTFVMLLTLIAADMPTTAKHTPLLEVYITTVMAFGAMAVLQCALTVSIYFRDEDEEIPRWMIRATKLGRKICPPAKKIKSNSSGGEKDAMKVNKINPYNVQKSGFNGQNTPVRRLSVLSAASSEDNDDITWKVISMTFDGVCFRIMTTFVTFFTFVFLICMVA